MVEDVSCLTGGNSLLKGVGARSPPGEEDRQADSLEQLGEDADTDLLERPLLDEELAEELLPVSETPTPEYTGKRAGNIQ